MPQMALPFNPGLMRPPPALPSSPAISSKASKASPLFTFPHTTGQNRDVGAQKACSTLAWSMRSNTGRCMYDTWLRGPWASASISAACGRRGRVRQSAVRLVFTACVMVAGSRCGVAQAALRECQKRAGKKCSRGSWGEGGIVAVKQGEGGRERESDGGSYRRE